jgi:hypothetical protein
MKLRLTVFRLLAVCVLLLSSVLSSVVSAQAQVGMTAAMIDDAFLAHFGTAPVSSLYQAAEVPVSGSGLLRYAGGIGVGALVIGAGLTWAFQQVRDQAADFGPGFNEYARLPSRWWTPVMAGFDIQFECTVSNAFALVVTRSPSTSEYIFWTISGGTATIQSRENNGGNPVNDFNNSANGCKPTTPPRYDDWQNGMYEMPPGAGGPVAHPDFMPGASAALGKYAKQVLYPGLRTGGQPAGITYTPKKPNENHWRGNPPFAPGIDTDGDGWSDQGEVDAQPLPTDPADPLSKPAGVEDDPNANPDGTCKSGFTRPGGVGACQPVSDPNQNPDGTCKTGFTRPAGGGACASDPANDPNANPDGTCKTGFVRPAGGVCQPEQNPDAVAKQQCEASGGSWNASTKVCTPAKTDKEKCQEKNGLWDEMTKSCGSNPTTTGQGECAQLQGQGLTGFIGNFWGSLTNTFLCVFKPQESIPEKLDSRFQTIKTKFPFSIVTALQNKVSASGNQNPDGLPSSLGNIPLDWSGIGVLWAIIKTASGFLIWFSFIWFIVSKITPQTTI